MNNEASFPDVFADGVTIFGGPYGISLTFLLSDPARQEELDAMTIIARIRFSPDLARTLGEALVKLGQAPEPAQAEKR